MIQGSRLGIRINGTTTVLTDPLDVEGQVGPGATPASFALLNDDPQRDLIANETQLLFYLLDDTDATVPIRVFVVKDISPTFVGEGEEAEEATLFSCLSAECLLADAIVHPATGIRAVDTPIYVGLLGTKPFGPDRYAGPMEPAFDDSGFGSAVEVAPPTGALSPTGWNDPQAMWIGGTGEFYHFRFPFSTLGPFAVSILHALSNDGELWLDGVLLNKLNAATDEDAAFKTRKTIVEVTDGDHLIYGFIQRIGVPDALLLCTVYERGTNTVVARSSSSWAASTDVLGMTPGALGVLLFGESSARGTLPDLGLTFSATHDSASRAWQDIVGQWGMRVVEDTYADVLESLSEAYIEYAVLPVGDPDASTVALSLSMWVARGETDGLEATAPGRGTVSTVTITKGVNATDVQYRSSTGQLKNVALMMFRDGILGGQIDDSVTAYGRREVGLTLGNNDGPSALNVGAATLRPIAQPETSITVEFDPLDDDETPFISFDVGDFVTIFAGDIAEAVRCVAISFRVNDYVEFTPEFVTARDAAAQRQRRWLNRTQGGTLEGRSRTATPTSPSIVETSIVEPYTDTISTPGDFEPEGGESTASKAMDTARRLVKLEAKAEDAGINPTVFVLTKNGSTAATVTLLANEVEATAWFDTGASWDVADTYGGRISSAGGHAGISVVATWVDIGG